MSEDAEVEIEFKAEAQDAQSQLERMDELMNGFAAKVKSASEVLESVGEKARDAAEAVQIMQERAGKSGRIEVVQAVEGAFPGGASRAAALGDRYEKLAAAMEALGDRAVEVSRDFQQGTLSLSQAESVMGRLVQQANKAERAVGTFARSVGDTLGDLGQSASLDNALASYNEVAERMQVLGSHAVSLRDELAQVAEGFAAQQSALDAAAPGFEQQTQKLMAASQAYGRFGSKVEEVISRLGAVGGGASASLAEAFSGGDAEGAEVAMQKSLQVLEQLEQKLEAVGNASALFSQKRAAEAEKAAEKESQSAESVANAEKEAAEREAYAVSLSLMGKQQLLQETERLSSARRKAAQAGDAGLYRKLGQQLSQARGAMRQLNQELAVTRIQWLQQAQIAGGLAGQIGSIGKSVSHLGDDLKNGELNVSGLAQAVIGLGVAIKTGLGPLGWALLALEALQAGYNYFVRSSKAAQEQTLRTNESIEEQARISADLSEGILDARMERIRKAADEEVDIHTRAQERLLAVWELYAAKEKAVRERELAGRKAVFQEEALQKEQAMLEGRLSKEAYNAWREMEERKIREKEELNEKSAKQEALSRAKSELEAARELERMRDREYSSMQKNFRWISDIFDQHNDEEINAALEEFRRWAAHCEQEKKKVDSLKSRIDAGDEGLKDELEEAQRDLRIYSNELAKYKKQYNSAFSNLIRSVERETGIRGLDSQGALEIADKIRQELSESNAKIQAARNSVEEAEKEVVLRESELELHQGQIEAQERMADTQKAISALQERQRKTEEEWTEVQKRSLKEQELFIRNQLASMGDCVSEASDVFKLWSGRLRQNQTALLADSVQALYRSTQLSGAYSKKDLRAQADILESDQKKLEQRRLGLLFAMSEARSMGESVAVVSDLQKKLQETRDAISGLKQNVQEAAIETIRKLRSGDHEQKLVALYAENEAKVARGEELMFRAQKRASASLERYGRALERGDLRAAERYLSAAKRQERSIESYGRALDQLTVNSDDGSRAAKSLAGDLKTQLRAIRRSVRAEEEYTQATEQNAAERRREKERSSQAREQDVLQQVDSLQQSATSLREQNARMAAYIRTASATLKSIVLSCQETVVSLGVARADLLRLGKEISDVRSEIRNINRHQI